MITKFLEIAEEFLIKKQNHLSREKIEQKAKDLGVTFPESMIDFYEFFGNNKEVLCGYLIFYNLEDIEIQNDLLIFGEWHQGQCALGIKLNQLSNENPQIFQYEWDTSLDTKQYNLECEYCHSFFLNTACWQVLNVLPDAAIVEIEENDVDNALEGFLHTFSEQQLFSKGDYRVWSYYSTENKILACYLTDIQELHIATIDGDYLEKFENETGLNLDWV